MKRIVLFAVILTSAAVFLLSGCKGPDGNVYIALDWVNTPTSIAASDPSIPSRVFQGAHYQTLPGTYYVEYTHPSYLPGYYRYLYYSLTANKGQPGFQPGDDARFTVWLYETMNPIIVTDPNPRAAASSAAPDTVGVPLTPLSTSGGKRVQQYQYTETKGGYDIHVEGGVIEPAD
jgi:hypothetical protein